MSGSGEQYHNKSVGTAVLEDRLLIAHDSGLRQVRFFTIVSSLCPEFNVNVVQRLHPDQPRTVKSAPSYVRLQSSNYHIPCSGTFGLLGNCVK